MIALMAISPITLTMINAIYSSIFNRELIIEQNMKGAIKDYSFPKISFLNFMNCSWQKQLDKYIDSHLVTKKSLHRVYNQMLYTLFYTTSNPNIIIGKDGYIFEKNYATALLCELNEFQKDELKNKISVIKRLSDALKSRNKILIVRISPSKAEYYSEYLPSTYKRFVDIKKRGGYKPNWYQVFMELIKDTDVIVYDRHELYEKLKQSGEIVFTKGGTHWSLVPMADYINGLNDIIHNNSGKSIPKIEEVSKYSSDTVMGSPDDDDILNLAFDCFHICYDNISPNISYKSTHGDRSISVFSVGQSFSTQILTTIFSRFESPIWRSALFSWYNSRIIEYSGKCPLGKESLLSTNDYQTFLNNDVIIIEFLESGGGEAQFTFAQSMLDFLE